MQFNSFIFILSFSVFFWLYWLLAKTKNVQNIFIVIASYAFYSYYDWRCSFLLFVSSLSAFIAGRLLNKERSGFLSKRIICLTTICFNLLILGVFKYANFFIDVANDVTGGGINNLDIILPVGISFYTFSVISYIVDIYRKDISTEVKFWDCMAYVSFFPSLLSGPIHKGAVQIPQFEKKREFNYELTISGFKDFLWGTFLKLCVANRLGMYVDAVYNNIEHHNGTTLLLNSFLYTIQIYADFAGYSLMAIGCGKMLGIILQTNFKRPYLAKTITEFWGRWHMSLTSWFKYYVYIPLGGNRVKKWRWMCNIMIVFLLSGLWHGAAYTFIIWGAIHGIVQIVEKIFYGQNNKNVSISLLNYLKVIITFCIVSFAWIFFRLPTLPEAITVIKRIFTDVGSPFINMHVMLFAAMSIVILIIKDVIDEFRPNIKFLSSNNKIVAFIACILLLLYIMQFGCLDSESFIYFQF